MTTHQFDPAWAPPGMRRLKYGEQCNTRFRVLTLNSAMLVRGGLNRVEAMSLILMRGGYKYEVRRMSNPPSEHGWVLVRSASSEWDRFVGRDMLSTGIITHPSVHSYDDAVDNIADQVCRQASQWGMRVAPDPEFVPA